MQFWHKHASKMNLYTNFNICSLVICFGAFLFKDVGAGTGKIGPVSELQIFLICDKGINLMEKNAFLIEIALKLLELRGYKETHPCPFLQHKIT